MTGFTSGYRAAHGLPKANRCYDCGEPATHIYRDAYGQGKHMAVCEADGNYYRAQGERVEFDVPDNPILADFRRLMGEIIQTDSWHTESPAQAAWWVQLMDEDPTMDNPNSWGHLAGSAPEHIQHARRVLHKLSAVYSRAAQ